MLSLTKDQIFKRVASSVNGEATTPSSTDTEYGTWSEFLEEANQEWPLAYDFRENKVLYQTTAPASGTSVALPAGTVKLLGFPEFDGEQYVEVNVEDQYLQDRPYVVREGNNRDGFYLRTSPLRGTGGTYVSASVRLILSPTAMATGSSVSPCPDPNFLVKRTTAKVLKQRGDAAFTVYDEDADTILARMIEQQVVSFGQLDSRTKTMYQETGFTVGVD